MATQTDSEESPKAQNLRTHTWTRLKSISQELINIFQKKPNRKIQPASSRTSLFERRSCSMRSISKQPHFEKKLWLREIPQTEFAQPNLQTIE
jgi:hypothetical protein